MGLKGCATTRRRDADIGGAAAQPRPARVIEPADVKPDHLRNGLRSHGPSEESCPLRLPTATFVGSSPLVCELRPLTRLREQQLTIAGDKQDTTEEVIPREPHTCPIVVHQHLRSPEIGPYRLVGGVRHFVMLLGGHVADCRFGRRHCARHAEQHTSGLGQRPPRRAQAYSSARR